MKKIYSKRTFLKFFLIFFILSSIFISTRILYLEEQGNFHIVTNNVLYRSAQLDRDELVYYIKKYNIKSIVNLRGKDICAEWYRQEIGISKKYKIMHYDYRLTSTSMIDIKKLKRILCILLKAPKPILIHCKAGADRSGLVAALWLYTVEKYPPKKALSQLSIVFGHFPYFGSKTIDMEKSFYTFIKKEKNAINCNTKKHAGKGS